MLYELGDGQWDIPALRRLLASIVQQRAVMEGYEVEHKFPTIGRRTMLLNARKIFYEGDRHTTVLLVLEDVTERRAAEREKDELLRQKDCCSRRCGIASPTASRSSRASWCSRRGRSNRRKRACACTTRTSE